jgi:hypothetical protein
VALEALREAYCPSRQEVVRKAHLSWYQPHPATSPRPSSELLLSFDH